MLYSILGYVPNDISLYRMAMTHSSAGSRKLGCNERLEFLGDSITAGYGVLAPKDRNTFYTYEEDSTSTYAYMTAQLLDKMDLERERGITILAKNTAIPTRAEITANAVMIVCQVSVICIGVSSYFLTSTMIAS